MHPQMSLQVTSRASKYGVLVVSTAPAACSSSSKRLGRTGFRDLPPCGAVSAVHYPHSGLVLGVGVQENRPDVAEVCVKGLGVVVGLDVVCSWQSLPWPCNCC
jgi:hypothetical protein